MGNRTIPLAKIGPTQIVLQQGESLPAGNARVVMTVDGHVRVWPVSLPHGAVPFDPEVEIRDL